MVLKSLLLQGFKSFPDKTEIRFLGGLTAIVGPNGSGKSNISDAIRWVLGEQSSRSLRGAKMEDVIFGGTEKRGSLGFAEVSLILSNESGIFNSDFAEIMVTRRYYRSGESEYALNKKHCRLRDIHELFMDTGLGRDGYSVIGQGRIDEILSLKSEDRREVFEEAAGITKFRYRKEEAERRLAATTENLVRIQDIYTELENQREPLQKQAEKAIHFLELSEELRILEVSLWLRSLSNLVEEKKRKADNSLTCKQQLKAARAAQETCYRESARLAAQMRQTETETEKLRTDLRQTEQRLADHASRCAVLQANISNDRNNIARIQQDSASQTEQLRTLEGQLAEREKRHTVLENMQKELLTRQASLHKTGAAIQQQNKALQETRAHLETQKEDCTAKRFSLELSRSTAQAALEGMQPRREALARQLQELDTRIQWEQRLQKEQQTQQEDGAQMLANIQSELAESMAEAARAHRKSEAQQKEVYHLEATHADTGNRIRMLREMQKEYEGFSHSVKRVMRRAESGALSGIHGPMSALLTVAEEYVLAIETALGAAASHILVDTVQAGGDAIEYLKRAAGGRATFLPLDTVRANSLREAGLQHTPGFCGMACDLVQYDTGYENAVRNVLGRTVIVESMDKALAMARTYHNRFRIVTKDGQMLQVGGAMTGGSASRSTGVLSRAAKLRAMEAQEKGQKHRIWQEKQKLEQAEHACSVLDLANGAAAAEQSRLQTEQARLAARAEGHATVLENLRMQYDARILERDTLTGAQENGENTLAQKEKEIHAADAHLQQLACQAAEIRDKILAQETTQTHHMAQQARLETELAENRAEVAAGCRVLEQLQEMQQNQSRTLQKSTEDMRRFESDIAQLRQELRQAEDAHAEDGDGAKKIHEEIVATAQKRMQIEGKKITFDKEAQTQGDEILNLERECMRLESQEAQLKEQEAQIFNKMWEQYELTPTSAKQISREFPDLVAAQEKMESLRSQRRALGNVNPEAVSQYETLMERYTFLKEQKQDLEQAQSEIYKIIAQLTRNMKEIFASEFAKLNMHFRQTFREIFGGGDAALRLEDTTDILNCGIEICVSLPGKALKTITLLSGGEKAFVAIALYFAILKVRPTPFCVLDEIEAALDDVNVLRFAKYMRKLAEQTQFIVITHRRGTMEEADMLYGVTMQEQGISKLLMLNLVEVEEQLGISVK